MGKRTGSAWTYMGLLMSHFTAETKYESSVFPKQISVEHTWHSSLIRYANEEKLLSYLAWNDKLS